MTRLSILPLFSRSGSPPSTCFLISYFFDIILMRQGLHCRPLPTNCNVVPLPGVTCAVQAVSKQSTHMFVTRLVVLGRQFDKHFSSCWTFPSRSPVAISDSTTFSASNGGVDAYSSGLACVLYSFATHLARTLGCPGCPLSVSAHPVLMGAFPVSRKHTSLGPLTYILCRRMYPTSSRLALAHSFGSSHPPLLSSQCHPSHTLSGFHETQPLVLSIFIDNAAYLVCILRSLFASSALFLCSRISSSCLSFFSCSSLALAASRTHVPVCSLSDHVFGIDPGMSMRAVAFALQPHPNLTHVTEIRYRPCPPSYILCFGPCQTQ